MSEEVPALKTLQQFVQSALAEPGGMLQTAKTAAWIAPSSRLTAVQRLSIYRRGYYARLLECMGGQYKVLRHTLGTELFDDFAAGYLQEHPSSSFTLSDLGAGFPDYLEATRPDAAETEKESWIDFMIALSRFEWAVYELFDKPGAEESGYAASATPDELLRLQPAFSLLVYDFPVTGYYKFAAGENLPEIPPRIKTYIALVRKNFTTGIFELSEMQHFLLQQFLNSQSPVIAIEKTAIHFGVDPESLKQNWNNWRGRWLDAGFFESGNTIQS